MTSQIFANIYLNEFDRFVRHELKPLGYVRYGDDFVLFGRNKAEVVRFQTVSTRWLTRELSLKVHGSNDFIFKTIQGLHFLGHQIYPHSPISVEKAMARKVKAEVNYRNIASYQAMHLPKKLHRRLPWLLIE